MSSGDPSDRTSLQVNFDTASKKVRFLLHEDAHEAHKKTATKLPRIKPKYFTAGCGVSNENQRDVLREPSPFVYPKDLKEFAHKVMTQRWKNQLRVKELSYKYNERHNCKSRQQADTLNRLYVKQPEVKSFVTVKDVNPNFYSDAEGRPIKEKLKLRNYIQTIRDVLRTKIVSGYRGDDIMLIDEKLILEQKQIDLIREKYQHCLKDFEDFLYQDHLTSQKLLADSENEKMAAQEKYEEFRKLSKEYAALRSVLYSTEEKWRNYKLYQRFLYMVSPISWRKQHDCFYKQEGNLSTFQQVSLIFDKYRLKVSDKASSLEELISRFRDDCGSQNEPTLYFTNPEQLLFIFSFMEMQNLESLLHSGELTILLQNVKEEMVQAEQLFKNEINSLSELSEKLRGGISWEEERAKYLEQLVQELINGEFKKLVIGEDVLNLNVFVEDVYESLFGPNDAGLGITEMMQMIEFKFREQLLSLDQMSSDQVVSLEISCYKYEAKTMKAAQQAARQLRELEVLLLKLQKVFSPPYRKTMKEIKWRSPPVDPPMSLAQPPRSLTEEEKDYLEFFTEYCKYTDDLKSYGIDISSQKSEKVEAQR